MRRFASGLAFILSYKIPDYIKSLKIIMRVLRSLQRIYYQLNLIVSDHIQKIDQLQISSLFNFNIIKILLMDNFAKYNQSMTIRSEKNRLLPVLPQKSFTSQNQESVKNQSFQKKYHQLQGSIRLLEKKYKQNLKDGFQDKIKSFRLQAVMQRKILKATIEQTKKQIQQQEKKQKAKRAKSQKQRESQTLQSIAQRVQQKRRRARSKVQRQRSIIYQKLKQQQERLNIQNKQAHDRISQQLKMNDRKKKYFETLKKIHYEREIEKQKKQYVSKIIYNNQLLTKLKSQLSQLKKSPKKEVVQEQHLPTPFITI